MSGAAWQHEDLGAPVNEHAWQVEVNPTGGIRVIAWSDDRSSHDTLILARAGVSIRVVLGPLPDLAPIAREFPVVEKLMPLIRARRRLLEIGATEPLPPILITCALAKELWPVFGMHGEPPRAGAAAPFGLFVVWAPELDEFAGLRH